MAAPRKADFVQPVVSEARVARIWAGVEEAKARRPRRARFIAGGLALGFATMLAFVVVPLARHRGGEASPAIAAGSVFDTGARTDRITLGDGSTVTLGPATRVAVVDASASSIRLRLERGHVECDVVHRPGRSFLVDADRALVEVKGTLFSVDRAADDVVAVHVERGAVEVRQRDPQPIAILTPGQSWSSRAPVAAPATADAGSIDTDELDAAPPHAVVASTRPTRESARSLFDRANAARVAGRLPEAAAAFDELWRHHPNDGHAALAAFESGRIQLDTLGDARAATSSFSFAASHAEGSFREDAEARLVEALARGGDQRRCKKTRERFLARYPGSAHRSVVAATCP